MHKSVKIALSSLLTGVLSVGLAWAGASLTPTPKVSNDDVKATIGTKTVGAGTEAARGQANLKAAPALPALSGGQVLAGASRISMEPRPQDFGGAWERDQSKCEITDGPQDHATHVPDFRVRWPENPNCLYMGGYGIGPVNSIVDWSDPYGLWIRVVAIGDGSDTIILGLVDGAYYEGRYNNMCGPQYPKCGFFDIAEALEGELGSFGVKKENFFLSFTHSHTSPEFIGGWGGVPKWYMDQITQGWHDAVKQAVASMRPAYLEIGEEFARQFSSERRDFYRSAEDQNLAWFRLTEPVAPDPSLKCGTPGHDKRPECQTSYRAIATVGAFAAHPVTADEGPGIGDADFPAVFSKRVEDRWGGVGILFQTGFGNVSPRPDHHEGASDKERIGFGLASLIPDFGGGRIVETPDVKSGQTFWVHPATNSALSALGVGGFFDRPFNQTPATVDVGKPSSTSPGSVKRCRSASPLSVRTAVSAAKIGSLWITGGPGELFSNMTNTIKEKNPTGVTLPLAVTNDGLGYIMQSFETDHAGRQGLGFVGEVVEYEDAYSIDHCFGDAVLEHTLSLLGSL